MRERIPDRLVRVDFENHGKIESMYFKDEPSKDDVYYELCLKPFHPKVIVQKVVRNLKPVDEKMGCS